MKEFKLIKKAHGISEYVLAKNGLRILLKQDKTYPVIGIMATYLVGSRHEQAGFSGSAHLLEHMMFKGTKNFNHKKETDMSHIFDKWGAYYNASTWNDRTNYFEVADTKHANTILQIQSEQMSSAIITKEDLSSEKEVVLSEYNIGQNSPDEILYTNVWSTAYHAHPYSHPTIGWKSDIENTSAEDLNNLYKAYYRPDNTVLSIVGNFNKEEILDLVEKHFLKIKNPPNKIKSVHTLEPKQEGARKVTVERNTPENIIMVAHKSPPATHKDTPALMLLSHILNGSRISRLEHALVDTGLATSTHSYYMPFFDNGLFIQQVQLTKKNTHKKLEKIILSEYKKLKDTPLSKSELKSAKAQSKSALSSLLDGPSKILSTLNEAIAHGNWEFYFTLEDKINTLTAKDVQEVAKKYLINDTLTVGYFKEK